MDHRTVMDLAGTDAAAYIRKSRLEEGMDTQEVLSKHQKALVEYAAAHQIHLIEIYPEVVSGESLYARPQIFNSSADCKAVCGLERNAPDMSGSQLQRHLHVHVPRL